MTNTETCSQMHMIVGPARNVCVHCVCAYCVRPEAQLRCVGCGQSLPFTVKCVSLGKELALVSRQGP
uniref:Uncharacterized protein n=1 Tax=Anguilla anguilla TaxID=7936 RepID=A0A0E9Q9I3_ANGAN